ncbi:MAG: chemotaxis protein CheA, partial [Pseudomonadales bacterium]|nr:chemotaxis protein CheA [Pseudomonadales bacterium]
SIRINIEKVDALINMVGEMVITQSMLCQLSKEYSEERHNDLVVGLAQLEANTREMQESVMSLRMMPISFAFNRFPRLVRDLNRQLEKDVDLVLVGEQTEMDKTVMEKLGDPLTHLVRNSMDHGMESPQERAENGKPKKGRIELKAFYEGGSVVIQISDDGKGLDNNKIREKAISSGLIQKGDSLSQDEIHELILRPGFSTAEKLSDVSGRGVGLDVVKQNIRALSGSLDVQSSEGVGTTFTIRLPLTLAIVDGQLIRVEDSVYILPLTAISESLQLEKSYINTIAGGIDLYRLRDENIPVVNLRELFGYEKNNNIEDTKMMVVVESNFRKIGLVVDELLDQQQVVIKSLESNYKSVEGLSGATILGDGTVALICDIHDILRCLQIKISLVSKKHANLIKIMLLR